jgi:hypothetical protein
MTNGQHTSARLREAALKAFESIKRPAAAHEIETWIAANDSALWCDINTKCYDYVRIILALSDPEMIMKYKCDYVLPGVDRRASFYGLPNGPYDPQFWRPIRSKTSRNSRGRGSRSRSSKSRAKPSSGSSAPEKKKIEPKEVKPPAVEDVVEPEKQESIVVIPKTDCNNSWCSLTTLIPPTDPFWKDFMESIDFMKFGINGGGCPEEILKGILARNPRFAHPVVVDDVVQILRSEAREQDEVNIFDEFDQFFP